MDSSTTNIPLIMYQPQNILVLLTFYSPLIIAVCVLSMSFIFQNFNGFIYLGFFIAVSILREFILMISGVKSSTANATASICSSVQYSKFGNSGFSVFAIAFTILYLCLPMFLNKDVNYVVFGILLAYLLLDIGIRSFKQCISKIDIFINLVTGATAGVVIPMLMYAGGSSKYLFFNEVSSNKQICSMPKKQEFKCKVFQNGELIGSTNK